MSFSTQTLTTKGSELLALATISDRLIIVGCDADTTVLDATQAQAISSRPANPLSNTTVVTSLSVSSSHIQCRAYFHLGDVTGGDANTFYLYGYLESDPSFVYVIYVLSDSNTTRIPATGDTFDEMEILFDITYNVVPNAIGFATQATYASQAEVDILKNALLNNVVTIPNHQEITGYKSFENGLASTSILVNSITVDGTFGSDSPFTITENEGSFKIESEDYGSEPYRKSSLEIRVSDGGENSIICLDAQEGDGDIYLSGSVEISGSLTSDSDAEIAGDLQCDSSIIFKNPTSGYKDVRMYCSRNTVFALEVPDYIDPPSGDIREYGSEIRITEDNSVGTEMYINLENGQGTVIVDCVVRLNAGLYLNSSGLTADTGQFTQYCSSTEYSCSSKIEFTAGIYGSAYSIEIQSTGTSNANLGSDLNITLADVPSLKVNNYLSLSSNITLKLGRGIEGLQPKVSSSTLSIPVGGIVMFYKVDSVDVSVGDMFTLDNNIVSSYRRVAKNNAGTWQAGDAELPNGKYTYLMEASGANVAVLIQRIDEYS